MELLFLGTGGAWGLPEHGCDCRMCRSMRQQGQRRLRTSLWLEGSARILIDPGPDLGHQLRAHDLPCPDAVLITHEHGDHYLGLDELTCFRRSVGRETWRPIPVYASAQAWAQIEPRFGYLLGSVLEKRLAEPGRELVGAPFAAGLSCRPVKVDHGPMPVGALGYVFTETGPEGRRSLGYTGDLVDLPRPADFVGLDYLVCQGAFLREPTPNRAHLLSLERALGLLRAWRPGRVAFVHLTCNDRQPDDATGNAYPRKMPALPPWPDPAGRAYEPGHDQASWDDLVARLLADAGLSTQGRMAFDGLRVRP